MRFIFYHYLQALVQAHLKRRSELYSNQWSPCQLSNGCSIQGTSRVLSYHILNSYRDVSSTPGCEKSSRSFI